MKIIKLIIFWNTSLTKIQYFFIYYNNFFDTIVSFETIEHLLENDIQKLFNLFSIALKKNGRLNIGYTF